MREISSSPRRGVNRNNPFCLGVDHVVAEYHGSSIYESNPMEVVQTEESWEPESRIPEWIRNPGIQVIIIPGWGIVSNNRWTLIVVIIVDDLRP